jgi:phosphoribosyl-dephospho-CoA transferase
MIVEPITHTLLRIAGAQSLNSDTEAPAWVEPSLHVASWVVVRRASVSMGLIPVGVRGTSRHERFASWVSELDVLDSVTPQALGRLRGWRNSTRSRTIAALGVLPCVDQIMVAHGFDAAWGPTGSVGFELASNHPTATVNSDLDVSIQLISPCTPAIAGSLHAALAKLQTHVDVLLEMPQGAVALAEYVHNPGSCIFRTTRGPRVA